MKYLTSTIAFILTVAVFCSCNSSGGEKAKLYCDTTCNNNPVYFAGNHPDTPFVTITRKNCKPDSVTWGTRLFTGDKVMAFEKLAGKEISLNDKNIKAYFNDTSSVWLQFMDCNTGQGFFAQLLFRKKVDIFRKNSAFSPFDPKYKIDENLVAYTDRGNVYVKDIVTGKEAMMTLGEKVEAEYSNLHEAFDSVNITPTHIWVKVKLKDGWKPVEKDITIK